MPAEQSSAPEDTYAAREEGLTASDFADVCGDVDSAACPDVMLTRDMIFDADDSEFVRVPCPEWGGVVFVRAISGRERNRLEADLLTTKEKDRRAKLETLRERLVVLAACDQAGRPLFGRGDIEWLGRKNAAPLDRIFAVAQRISGISTDDVDKLVKN